MSAFGRFNPIVTAIYFAEIILVAMFVNNPIIQAMAFTGGLLFCITLQSKRDIKSDFGFYLPLFIIIAFSNPLFSHNGVTPLFFINGNAITLEAIIYGIFLAVTIVAVVIWFKCFSIIMTSDRLLYLFGKAVPKLSLVISMAFRFVPMLKRQAQKVRRAQRAMGIYASESLFDRIKSAFRVYGAVIGWAFENAIDTAASMKARGYGLCKRTNFSLFRFCISDAVFLVCSVTLSVICIVGITSGAVEFVYYPTISEVNTSLSALAVYVAYGILVFIPFIIEVKEALVWKFCVSRI